MTTWNRTAGSTGDTVVAYLHYDELTGTPVSGKSYVGLEGETGTELAASTSIGVDPNGVPCLVHIVQLGSWLAGLTVKGEHRTYRIRHRPTFSDGADPWWPDPGHDEIIVSPARL